MLLLCVLDGMYEEERSPLMNNSELGAGLDDLKEGNNINNNGGVSNSGKALIRIKPNNVPRKVRLFYIDLSQYVDFKCLFCLFLLDIGLF